MHIDERRKRFEEIVKVDVQELLEAGPLLGSPAAIQAAQRFIDAGYDDLSIDEKELWIRVIAPALTALAITKGPE